MGITRAPNYRASEDDESPTAENGDAANAKNLLVNNGLGNGSILAIKDGLNNGGDKHHHHHNNYYNNDDDVNNENEEESLQYNIKPGEDDLNIAYSEGTQKTDLLY